MDTKMKKMHMRLNGIINLGILFILGMGSCSEDKNLPEPTSQTVSVVLDLKVDSPILTKAPGDIGLSVNRVLVLPFRKTSESLTNDAANFVPDYNTAEQIDVTSFPLTATRLNLSSSSTYQIVMIGYNQSDYDFTNPNNVSRRFSTGPTSGATLANFYLQAQNPTIIPEFYVCSGQGYMNGSVVGTAFKPGQIDRIIGKLTRLVSGLTLTVTNIPIGISSISLIAEQLVIASQAFDAKPSLWQIAGDSGPKTLGTMSPVLGRVAFNLFLLPTWDNRSSLFYIDITQTNGIVHYPVKLPDTPGLSIANRISLLPNYWLNMTGSYTNLNTGFILLNNINLDDPAWDGLQ